MFLHKFGHIQPNQRFGCVKQFIRKLFHKFRFTDTRRADKNERRGAFLHGQLHTTALNGRGNQIHGFILPDDMRFQAILHTDQAFDIALDDFGGRNARPKVDHLCQIRLNHAVVTRFFF